MRVLVSTLTPGGGVEAMTAFVVDALTEKNYEPVLAHYEPYSLQPHLSVPLWALLTRGIGVEPCMRHGGVECHAIGAWLPELEFTHYHATAPWHALIASCDYHIAVAGNVLAATPFLQTRTPYLAWVATGWKDDRTNRAAGFPPLRRTMEYLINEPVIARLERRLLAEGYILALSKYTAAHLDGLTGPQKCRGVLPMPIDAEAFRPDPVATVRGRIGCCGRLSDPRKNISLLLAAAEKLIDEGNDITVDLIGMGRNELERFFSVSPQLTNRLDVTPCLPRKDLARHLAKLDVYVVASHQEGLCIAALEAMACGCPVVSTRCGGPEEFVINDKTGFVVGFSATEMANRIGCIVGNRVLRERLSDAARTYVIGHYAPNLSRQVFWDHFEMAFAKSMRDQPIQKNAQNLRQHMQTRSG